MAAKPIVTLADILESRERIRSRIYLSPCAHSIALSHATGQQVYLKLDNLQMTGSFKERGALNKILQLTPDQAARGVVAASAGNHAQAVAHLATERGIRSVIVMPVATPLFKLTATRNYGAEVVLHGASYDEAYQEAVRIGVEQNMTFIHAFDDPAIIAGQGTVALEMLEQHPQLEAIVAPIGGGGLISGIAVAAKAINPKLRIIGVQTDRVPSMLAARTAHHPVTVDAAPTIADGIAVRRAGSLTLPLVEQFVDELVTVDEDEIAAAILILLEREKTLAEGAGAAALAALLQRKTTLHNAHTGVLVCGGNIDVTLLSRIIERGLVQDGRMLRLRIFLFDKPGALAELARLFGEHRANIVDTLHNRSYYGVNIGDTVVDITLETRGREHVRELLDALTTAGYRHSRVL